MSRHEQNLRLKMMCVMSSENAVKMVYGPYGWVVGPADKVAGYGKCCCGSVRDGGSRRVTLLFDREALLYDIANVAYVEGDVMQTDNAHDRHQVMDIAEQGNVDRVTRVLDLAHSECVEALYPFTKVECDDGAELDDLFGECASYVIVLRVPERFSGTTARLLEQLIHEYMVAMVLADWLGITCPAAAEKWAVKARGALDEVKRKLHWRMGVLTRPLRPF